MFYDWSHVNQPTSTCDTNLHAEVTVKYLYFMHFQPFPLSGISAPNIVLNKVVCLFWKVCPIADYLWHSRKEIEYYSVAYFERITKFDVL